MVVIALLLLVMLLLGGVLTFTAWHLNRLATRWTTLQRHLDGAIAGAGILLAAPLGALALGTFLGGPAIALGRRLGWLTAWSQEAELWVALACAAPGAIGASALIGACCVRPWRRGALCGVGVLTFAITTGAATWLSPLSNVTLTRWASVLLASSASCLLSGGALLAAQPPEEP